MISSTKKSPSTTFRLRRTFQLTNLFLKTMQQIPDSPIFQERNFNYLVLLDSLYRLLPIFGCRRWRGHLSLSTTSLWDFLVTPYHFFNLLPRNLVFSDKNLEYFDEWVSFLKSYLFLDVPERNGSTSIFLKIRESSPIF